MLPRTLLRWLLPTVEIQSSVPVHEASESSIALVYRRQDAQGTPCRLNFTTNVWTGCQDVLDRFHLSLSQFIASNPGVGEHCDNFVPGNTYCGAKPSPSFVVSPDGRCGKSTTTCVHSGFGDCCNASGQCGSGEAFCGKGNCQEGDCDGGVPYSTDGNCGDGYGFLSCPPKFGLCCSWDGRCGNDTSSCGEGCQDGPCLITTTSTSTRPTSTSTTSSQPTVSPGAISPDGQCGYNLKYKCRGSKFGNCCSAAGYCGSSLYECSDLLGCQPEFGDCTSIQTSITAL